MMDEELHLQPVQAPDIFRSAIVITIATLIGHLIPLLPRRQHRGSPSAGGVSLLSPPLAHGRWCGRGPGIARRCRGAHSRVEPPW